MPTWRLCAKKSPTETGITAATNAVPPGVSHAAPTCTPINMKIDVPLNSSITSSSYGYSSSNEISTVNTQRMPTTASGESLWLSDTNSPQVLSSPSSFGPSPKSKPLVYSNSIQADHNSSTITRNRSNENCAEGSAGKIHKKNVFAEALPGGAMIYRSPSSMTESTHTAKESDSDVDQRFAKLGSMSSEVFEARSQASDNNNLAESHRLHVPYSKSRTVESLTGALPPEMRTPRRGLPKKTARFSENVEVVEIVQPAQTAAPVVSRESQAEECFGISPADADNPTAATAFLGKRRIETLATVPPENVSASLEASSSEEYLSRSFESQSRKRSANSMRKLVEIQWMIENGLATGQDLKDALRNNY